MQRLSGIGVSPGIGVGRAVVVIQRAQVLRFSIAPSRVQAEIARLEAARRRSADQLDRIQGRLPGRDLGGLFEAQRLMLDDPMLLPRAGSIVHEQLVNAEWALHQVVDHLGAIFDEVEDPYLRERKGDLADVVGRLRMNLTPGGAGFRELLGQCEAPCVLVADDLAPSVAAQLDWNTFEAFITNAGSRTYHTAILARSLHVPAVVGLHDATDRISPGMLIMVDGEEGTVVLEPSPEVVRQMAETAVGSGFSRAGKVRLKPDTRIPLQTLDGVTIRVEANVDFLSDTSCARDRGAEGIGLFRSELLLADRPADELTEALQYDVYRQLLEDMAPAPVTVRTFDIDEDQLASGEQRRETLWVNGYDVPRSRLGLRSIRLTLKRRELLRTQLRALVRAAKHGELRVMFPFVSGVEELREAHRVLTEARQEIEARGEMPGLLRVGVMIEVPSAALTADLLAAECDFLTIGTNDLIQCSLAVDRTDERVSHLYEPLHPAILRLIRHVRRAAAKGKVPLSVCGEMASDPAMLALLIGMGLVQFSMTPAAIPMARDVIQELDSRDLRGIALHALKLQSAPEIEQFLADAVTVGRILERH
ncbi:MAG TPA: phosphoenolpyruvate--protein phosphotransferase [Vicinamibacterales bacterium]|nr:phosphoenolpyruvate--protein phosphotransferase [Vicinamibacterales bacterium]